MSEKIELCSHDECTGCFACEGICPKSAIHQYIDNEGFRYPIIDYDKCVLCHACEKVCPVITPINKNPAGEVYAAWSFNNDIRTKSSSGGLYSELAKEVLLNNGVVVGASMNNDGYVHHTIITEERNIGDHRGSKYVQSMLSKDVFRSMKAIIKDKRIILFTGCPCQVAAARSYLKDSPFLYTIDLVCHGVPSPEIFARVYSEIKKEYPNIVSYNFRKLDSWGVCSSVNININNVIVNRPLTGKYTFYQDAFLKGLMNRLCCYNCQYTKIERVGDITLADFWGVGSFKPIHEDYKGGCSMVSVNSEKGKLLFEKMNGSIYSENRDINETIQNGNKQLVEPSEKPYNRDTFYLDFHNMELDKLISKYNLKLVKKPSILGKLLNKTKCIINKKWKIKSH